MVQSLLLAALTFSHHINVAWILGLSIMQGCINAFDMPGRQSFMMEMVSEKGAHLNHKQQSGVTLTAEEISDFEEHRDALINNPVARRFMDAQEQMHQIKESVNKYVSKTFELGRLPTDADFEEGGCGSSSCGCHH